MTKYVLDYDKIVKGNFEEGRIKRYAEDCFCGNELASVLYLWAFNNFTTNTDEVKYDNGRPMYRNLANKLTTILKPEREVSLEQIANMELRDQLEAKEQMIKNYKKAISSALNYMACPDRISETECNEQLAFNVLREVLK